jgi:NitT/TauT family transport system substrate-binding protein
MRVKQVVVAVAAMMLLAACGSDPEPVAQSQSGLPQPEKTRIKIGLAAFEFGTLATRIAAQEGIFEKYGLSVELVQLEGDGPAAQALIAGQVDGAAMGGAPIFSAKAAGTDLKAVFMFRSTPTDTLATPVAINSGADLRGKKIAISTYGGDSHIAVLVALQSLGLSPKDAVVVQIGGQGDRYAALQSGAVAAAPIEGISDQELAGHGLHPLVRLSDTGLKLARAALVLSDDFIKDNPNTTLSLVAAVLEAHTRMLAEPKLATEVFAKAAEISVADAEPRVLPQMRFVGPDGRATSEMFAPQKAALEETTPGVKGVDPTSVFTNEFIDRLESEGYFKKIGVGGSKPASSPTPSPSG